MDKIKKLEKQIEQLREQLEKNKFGGIFDRESRTRSEKKLRKLEKELEELKK